MSDVCLGFETYAGKKRECTGIYGQRQQISFEVVLPVFRKQKVAYFLSHVEYRPNTNTSNIIYAYKYKLNMYYDKALTNGIM
jgi:hypothetical protein